MINLVPHILKSIILSYGEKGGIIVIMGKRVINYMLVVGIIFVMTSCISLFGTKKTVYITSNPLGAAVYRASGRYVGITPCFDKSKGAHDYLICKNGFYDYSLETSKKINNLVWLNLLWGGPAGLLPDIACMTTCVETSYSISLSVKPQPTMVTASSPLPEKEELANTFYTAPNASLLIKPAHSVSQKNRKELKGNQIFKLYKNAVFMIYGGNEENHQIWQGSGFIINERGLAISNYHNFEGASEMLIKFYGANNDYLTVEKEDILAYSKKYDYIIFRIHDLKQKLSYIPVACKMGEVGDKVFTIGSPRGLENTMSSGEISQFRENAQMIQISAPIDHGSSGGVLLNVYGEAIGITSAGLDDSGANLNFARNLIYILSNYKYLE